MGLKWDSPEFWAAVKWDHAAVSCYGRSYLYEAKPERGSSGYYLNYCKTHVIDILVIENVPKKEDWEESLICRPAVRGSDEYWANAPAWANWAVVMESGYDYWSESEPMQVDGDWWLQASAMVSARKDLSADNWRNSKIQRPYAWKPPDENTPVDTPVFERDFVDQKWKASHTASSGRVWIDGRTSHTSATTIGRNQIVLADPIDPSRVPPTDLLVGLET